MTFSDSRDLSFNSKDPKTLKKKPDEIYKLFLQYSKRKEYLIARVSEALGPMQLHRLHQLKAGTNYGLCKQCAATTLHQYAVWELFTELSDLQSGRTQVRLSESF